MNISVGFQLSDMVEKCHKLPSWRDLVKSGC
jgi:hypothetical protein